MDGSFHQLHHVLFQLDAVLLGLAQYFIFSILYFSILCFRYLHPHLCKIVLKCVPQLLYLALSILLISVEVQVLNLAHNPTLMTDALCMEFP